MAGDTNRNMDREDDAMQPEETPQGPGRNAEGRMRLDPLEVERYLSGVKYPMRKGDLVDSVRRQGAPEDVVRAVEELPDRQFESPRAISDAMAGPSGPGR